jgi:hypothetical protein
MSRGELPLGEPHPAAYRAQEYIAKLGIEKRFLYLESFSSCAISGKNMLAEVCSETLNRLMHGDPVSDRYLLGLAWTIRNMEESDETPKSIKPTDEDRSWQVRYMW